MRLKTLLAPLALFTLIGTTLALAAGPYPTQNITNRFGGGKNVQLYTGGSNQIDCGFTVASADAAGKGITGLASAPSGDSCASVYMHTSQTQAGPSNPPSGYVIVNFAKSYQAYVAGVWHIAHSPATGTTGVASLSANTAYQIAAVGTTSTANWQALGLPLGVTPAVGMPFVVPTPFPSPTPSGTGTAAAPTTAGTTVTDMEVVGSPVVTGSGGAQVILRFMAPTSAFSYNSGTPASSTVATTMVATQPADGTVVGLRFTMKANAILLQ